MSSSRSNPQPCPHLEAEDARCNHRFTLPRMDQAFSVCMRGWRGCPVYQMLQHQQAERESKRHAISITVRGSDEILARVRPIQHASGQPLRPTGT